MQNHKGFSLVEVLLGILIVLILLLVTSYLVSSGYTKMENLIKEIRGTSSVLSSLEIIDSDLKKAGYGEVKSRGYEPVSWNSTSKTLTIRFVDYEETGCENATWRLGDNCSYKIQYTLDKDNLYRIVDKGADGSFAEAPMFNEKLVKITNFEVHINKNLVFYTINGTVLGRPFTIGSEVICRNW